MENHDYLSIGEAAEMMGVCVDTLRKWARQGDLSAAMTPGGHRRFLRQELQELMRRRSCVRSGIEPTLEQPYLKLDHVCNDRVTTTFVTADLLREIGNGFGGEFFLEAIRRLIARPA